MRVETKGGMFPMALVLVMLERVPENPFTLRVALGLSPAPVRVIVPPL